MMSDVSNKPNIILILFQLSSALNNAADTFFSKQQSEL